MENFNLFTIGFANLTHSAISRGHILFSFISSVESGSIKSSLNGRLIDNNTIFLVVSSETGHSDYGVGTNGHLKDRDILSWLCGYEWSLWVIQKMRQGLHADLIVKTVQAHGLLRHGALEGIFCGLVVIRERDYRGAHSEEH